MCLPGTVAPNDKTVNEGFIQWRVGFDFSSECRQQQQQQLEWKRSLERMRIASLSRSVPEKEHACGIFHPPGNAAAFMGDHNAL